MENISNIQKLDLYRKISDKTNSLSILTGSLALIISGEIPERDCNDIDIVLPYYVDLSEFGTIKRIENDYTTPTIEIKNNLCVIHVIIDPKCIYTIIEEIKVSNAIDIWVSKFKSFMFFGSEKNLDDIELMIKKYRDDKTNKDNEMPF